MMPNGGNILGSSCIHGSRVKSVLKTNMASGVKEMRPSRRRLARIRCLRDCVDRFRDNKELPQSLCYVSAEQIFAITKKVKVIAFSEANHQAKIVCDVLANTGDRIVITGEELCNSHGQWGRIIKFCKSNGTPGNFHETPLPASDGNSTAWILMYSIKSSCDETPIFTPLPQTNPQTSYQNITWQDVVENEYSLDAKNRKLPPFHEQATGQLQSVPPTWTLDHDEDLAQFLCSHIETQNDNLGSIKQYVDSIDVSSSSETEGPDNLTDGDPDTYWESDGNQGLHWIRLKMKKGTIIKKLSVVIDASDDNYMPYRIIVQGGDSENLRKLSDISVDQSMYGVNDVVLLEDQTEHYGVLEIAIKECKDDGIDTRIHGIKIKSTKERDVGLNRDLFSPQNLVRYPKLENIDPNSLYKRAQVLQRFVTLLDSVLQYLVPSWGYSVDSYNSLEVVRQFLPLSKKRMCLIETFLRESESSRPSRMPKLYINRRAAADHKSDPSLDPECKNTVFNQIYEGLKPRDRFSEKTLDFRWPARFDQWWECKFLAEGIIDQGGGFRDSLSDISDELCPTANDVPVPLPLFVRAPNQSNADMNVNRDVYVPNPSCQELHKHRWLGQLMGACLRGKENLVITLPAFVWKKLSAERVTWTRDFPTVDEAEVKMMDNMENMDEESFDAYFGNERGWTTVLSGGEVRMLKPHDDSEECVRYQDRHEYARLVQQARMTEADQQLSAIRTGLLSVVPQAVLDLLSWQELERRVCGDPEVSIAALKRSAHYEDLEEDENRIKFLWEALSNFSNEDRSRFLRFVTGRRRLPAPLYICPDKGDSTDCLPESSTCSNTLYLPSYSSAKMAEEKLRYAAYNCIAIDTDMSPWDEE